MKKTILLMLTALAGLLSANAHDYAIQNEQGVTIYYKKVNTGTLPKLEVTYRGSSPGEYRDSYKGSIILPPSVLAGGIMYFSYDIGEEAFRYCEDLTSVTIPYGVISIGDYAFCWSGLSTVTIPASVTSIGENTFASCKNLQEFIVFPTNTSYSSENGVLFNKDKTVLMQYPAAKIQDITLPDNLTAIEPRAFLSSKLTHIAIPDKVTSIGSFAFSGCINLASVSFGKGLKTIEEGTFDGCALTSVEIPDGITSIGNHAFSSCENLASVSFGKGLKTIEEGAFKACVALTDIIVPEGVTSIGIAAFSSCLNAKSITLPGSLTDIEEYAFGYSPDVEAIHNHSAIPQALSYDIFEGNETLPGLNKSTCRLYVPVGSLAAYKEADIWKDFTHIIEENNTAIPQIQLECDIYVSGNTLHIQPLHESVSIYSLQGNLLYSQPANADRRQIDISALPKGVYIVKAGGKTGRFIK